MGLMYAPKALADVDEVFGDHTHTMESQVPSESTPERPIQADTAILNDPVGQPGKTENVAPAASEEVSGVSSAPVSEVPGCFLIIEERWFSSFRIDTVQFLLDKLDCEYYWIQNHKNSVSTPIQLHNGGQFKMGTLIYEPSPKLQESYWKNKEVVEDGNK